ncbi:MAG: hypothetical protein HC811_03680 [Flammeovirgaceae bacterium]|nr:hypothetical protein [Flammeovirgaceae bacterium]
MKKLIFLLLPISVMAQTGSEIMLMDLKLSKNGIEVSNPKNVTNHPGYDNQPFFILMNPYSIIPLLMMMADQTYEVLIIKRE